MQIFNVQALDLRRRVQSKNGTLFITLPKDFCNMVGITGENQEVNVIVHQIIDKGNMINLCVLKY